MNVSQYIMKGFNFLFNKDYRLLILASCGIYDYLPDEKYLRKMFKARLHKELNLDEPQTFNEKLQWLKLYNRKPEYTMMVDKYKVREYIAKTLGEEYLIPLIGVWDAPDEIDFDALPDQFVLKCNHNSGLGMCICKDKSKLDIPKVKAELRKGLKQDYYLTGREWPYKDVPRKIIAERYMIDKTLNELRDYKFFCFNGEVKCFKVDYDRYVEHHANYYDINGQLLPFGEADYAPKPDRQIEMPYNLNKMVEMANRLSHDCPFVRVDFYEIDQRIYFGELTFFPASGMGAFAPETWDGILGGWLTLPEMRSGR